MEIDKYVVGAFFDATIGILMYAGAIGSVRWASRMRIDGMTVLSFLASEKKAQIKNATPLLISVAFLVVAVPLCISATDLWKDAVSRAYDSTRGNAWSMLVAIELARITGGFVVLTFLVFVGTLLIAWKTIAYEMNEMIQNGTKRAKAGVAIGTVLACILCVCICIISSVCHIARNESCTVHGVVRPLLDRLIDV